jgi:cytochrome P450
MPAETQADSQRKVPRDQATTGCPVHVDSDGVWHIEGYAPARAVLRNTETRQAGFGVENAAKLSRKIRPPVLWHDGPEHREQRRKTAKYFTPRRVAEKYRELMHAFADEQITRLRRTGRADLSDLSFDLAVAVAGEVIGLAPARRGMARRLDRFFKEYKAKPGWRSPAQLYRLLYQNFALMSFFLLDVRPATRLRQKKRRDDLISHMLSEGCNIAEILSECVTFGAAGMITTREFIVVAAWHLFTNDDLRRAYVDGDEAARFAILHEILRVDPVVGNLSRWADADFVFEGEGGPVTVPAGARIDIMISQTNVDPAAVGTAPTQVCPGRALADGVADAGLAFGEGPHRCPGAHVAIHETEIFLTKLFTLPNLRMARPPTTRIRPEISSYELVSMILAVD